MLQRKKLLPLLMSGVTFHFISELENVTIQLLKMVEKIALVKKKTLRSAMTFLVTTAQVSLYKLNLRLNFYNLCHHLLHLSTL